MKPGALKSAQMPGPNMVPSRIPDQKSLRGRLPNDALGITKLEHLKLPKRVCKLGIWGFGISAIVAERMRS